MKTKTFSREISLIKAANEVYSLCDSYGIKKGCLGAFDKNIKPFGLKREDLKEILKYVSIQNKIRTNRYNLSLKINSKKQGYTLVPNIVKKLNDLKIRTISYNVKNVLRTSNLKIVLSNNPNKFNATHTSTTDYGGRYPETTHYNTITVPSNWRLRVDKLGISNLGNMFTLDAFPCETKGDFKLYSAMWISQGRGYNLNVHKGFIAVKDNESCHALTSSSAISGLKRKLSLTKEEKLAMGLKLINSSLSKKVKQNNHLYVTLQDAYTVGSCDSGIRSWCNHVGLNYYDGKAPIELVMKGYELAPLSEVRRTLLYTLRNSPQ